MKIIKFLFKFILILLLVVVILVGGSAAFLFFSTRDTVDNTPEEVRKNNYSTTQVIHNQMTTNLRSEDTDLKINFDALTLNYLVYGFIQNLKIPQVTLKGAYAEFDEENNLYIELPVKASFHDTSLKLRLGAKEENRNFTFTLKEAKIGNLSAFNFITEWALNQYVSEDNLEKTLASRNITCDISLKDKTITFTKDNLLNFMDKALASVENVDLYKLLIKYALEKEDVISFNLGKDKSLGFTLLMDSIKYDAATQGTLYSQIDYSTLNTLVSNSLKEVPGKFNPDNIDALYKYYLRGYGSLNDEEKTQLKNTGATINESNAPMIEDESNAVKEEIISKDITPAEAANAVLTGTFDIEVSEESFNKSISNNDIIGKGKSFVSYDGLLSSSISVESMYVDINKDELDLRLVINLGGRRVSILMDMTAPSTTSTSSMKITGNINNLSLGRVAFNEEDQKTLLAFIKNANTLSYLGIDDNTRSVTIDLAEFIGDESSNPGLAFVMNHLGKKTVEFTENNTLKITFAKSL